MKSWILNPIRKLLSNDPFLVASPLVTLSEKDFYPKDVSSPGTKSCAPVVIFPISIFSRAVGVFTKNSTVSLLTADAHSSQNKAQSGGVLRAAQEPTMFYACVAISESYFCIAFKPPCATGSICISFMRKIAVHSLNTRENAFFARDASV